MFLKGLFGCYLLRVHASLHEGAAKCRWVAGTCPKFRVIPVGLDHPSFSHSGHPGGGLLCRWPPWCSHDDETMTVCWVKPTYNRKCLARKRSMTGCRRLCSLKKNMCLPPSCTYSSKLSISRSAHFAAKCS